MNATPSPDAESHPSPRVLYPQIFHRTFACGHPDEFIEIRSLDNGERIHNLITLEIFEEWSQAGIRPTYSEARCLTCAKNAKDKDDGDPRVQPKRTLSAYRSGTSSTYKKIAIEKLQHAFEGPLGRYRWSSNQAKIAKLHARVPEQDHRAHRRGILKEAVESPGKWLALPVRRVMNIPVRTTGGIDVVARLKPMSHSDDEYEALLRAKIGEQEEGALRNDRQSHKADFVLSQSLLGPGSNEVDHSKDMDVYIVAGPLFENIARSEDEDFHLAARNMASLSGSRLNRQRKDGVASIADSDEACLLGGATKLYQARVGSSSLGKGSAFTGTSIKQSCDDSFASSPDPTKYINPRPVPVVPRRGTLSFKKRRSNTTTRASTYSEPLPKNSPQVSLDITHSTRSLRKREPHSASPDWACVTAVAVEAGRNSVDSVGAQTWKSTSSKYSSEAEPSSTEVSSVARNRREAVEGVVKREGQPPLSSNYSTGPSTADRHSEGALQAVRRVSSTFAVGKLRGLKSAFKRKPSRRQRAQAASVINLNKSLPALPLPGDENVGWL